jgi:hypothetical protein
MSDTLISQIKEASGVFVEETDAMIQAQRLLVEGVKPDDIVKMFEASRVAARLMGTDVKEAADRVMEALVTLRVRGLKAAFPMDQEEVIKKYAAALHVLPDELDEVGKREALVNEIWRQTQERLEILGPLIESEAEKLEKYRSAWDHLKESISKTALVIVGEGIEAFKKIAANRYEPGPIRGIELGEKILPGKGEWPSETRFINYVVKTIEDPPMKDVIDNTKRLENAFKELGITSQENLSKMAQRAYDNMKMVEEAYGKGTKSVADYVRAIEATTKAMEKVTLKDVTKQIGEKETEKLDKLNEGWDELDRKIKALGDDPDRARKAQALTDDWMKARGVILNAFDKFKTEMTEKLKIPTSVDIQPALDELDKLIKEASQREIVIKVRTEGGESESGVNVWGIPIGDFFGGGGAEGEANINFFGIGSTRKPIMEKIREIIGEFGGLGQAMAGMEAEINVAELSMEYKKFDAKLNEITQSFAQTANMMFMHGYSYNPDMSVFNQVTADLVEQMRILQMKMDYETLKGYGGSMQIGGIVPKTGLYTLHEGEKVVSKNLSMGDIHIHVEGGQDVTKTLVKTLKYKLSSELRGLL